MLSRFEGVIGMMVMIGVAMMAIGLVMLLLAVLGLGSVASAGTFGLIGVAIAGGPVILSLLLGGEKLSSKAPLERSPGCQILNKIATDKRGSHALDLELYDEDELRLYVKVLFPTGKQKEFRTQRDIYESIGEGMFGTVIIQGDWIGGFEPHQRPENPSDRDRFTRT